MALFDFLTQDIAIDLGTANTIIIHNEKVVVDQPSIVAVDRTTGKVIAVGKQAQMMHGKTHENINNSGATCIHYVSKPIEQLTSSHCESLLATSNKASQNK